MNPSTAPNVRLPDRPIDFSAVIDGDSIPTAKRDTIERSNPAHGVPVSRYPRATRAVGVAGQRRVLKRHAAGESEAEADRQRQDHEAREHPGERTILPEGVH